MKIKMQSGDSSNVLTKNDKQNEDHIFFIFMNNLKPTLKERRGCKEVL